MNTMNLKMLLMSQRRGDVVLVDIVGRDRGLREIVEQVVGEHLDRQHRQKGQKQARAEHAEHVAEIGARAHLDVFGDVGEDFSAFGDALLQHEQALFQNDDVGWLLCDIDRRIDRDADIGRLHCRTVVDAIPGKSRPRGH
jgi:hypothetical protein